MAGLYRFRPTTVFGLHSGLIALQRITILQSRQTVLRHLSNSQTSGRDSHGSCAPHRATDDDTNEPHQATAFPPKSSLLTRALGLLAIAVVFTSAGFTMAALPAFKTANSYLNPPSDEETLSLFTPEDGTAREVEHYINHHPLALDMRSRAEYSESRPHLKMPESVRSHSLTGGTLRGSGKVVVPPLVWSDAVGESLVSVLFLGVDLCGHPGIVHGGLLATLLDEGFAKCCFAALPNTIGMTANLNINFRNPALAGSYVVLRARTIKVEGRKAWVNGHIETLVAPGEKPVILAEASALFIEPRQAASMAKVYHVQ